MIVSTMKGELGMGCDPDLSARGWRTSSHSSQGADCVEVTVFDTVSEH
jgi:hypothetical protein